MKVLPFTIPVPVNQTIIVQKDLMPFFYPHLHRHHEIQLTWVRKGEGTLVADNNMHRFVSNEIYWLGANQPHLFKSDPSYFLPKSKKTIDALTIFFNPAGQLASFFELPEVLSVRKFIQQHNSGFKVPEQNVEELSNNMLQAANSQGVGQLIHFMDLFKKLMSYENLTPLSSSAPAHTYSEHEGIRIATIYNYIMQHYAMPITLEDIARQAHMTPQAFCRYFKKHTRITFVNFLSEVRINEACKKLTEGSYDSITTVAYNCGFNSITNFNRVFKRVTSFSPSAYVDHFFQKVEPAQ